MFLLDEAVYKMVEIFKYNDSNTYKKKITRTRNILENFAENVKN